jgi:hypothetical protein
MFRVRWKRVAVNQLARFWTQASSKDRHAITKACHRVEQCLKGHPLSQGESRPADKRVVFDAPLGVLFQIDSDRQEVLVLRAWFYRKRPSE